MRVGTYDDGSGRLGLAALAWLSAGAGPASTWPGSAAGPSGPLPAPLAWEPPHDAGTYAMWTWPGVAPALGSYTFTFTPPSAEPLSATFVLSGAQGLALPVLQLGADASALHWASVPGALSYECDVRADGARQAYALVRESPCDLSMLPPGAYTASVRAVSAELGAQGLTAQGASPLADGFHVSESRIAFLRPDGTEGATQLQVAGGGYEAGLGSRTLAVWISIAQADGTPTPVSWELDIVGPGLTATEPLRVSYPALLPRRMVWSYDVPAAAGTYTLVARSATAQATAHFVVGEPRELSLPLEVTAAAKAPGAASVSWLPVEGARSYLVSAYERESGAFIASFWHRAPPADFPASSFTAGRSYDVYVAASDVDMLEAPAPTQVAVSENLFSPTTFVAR